MDSKVKELVEEVLKEEELVQQKQQVAFILQKYWDKLGYEDFDALDLLDDLIRWKHSTS